MLQTKYITLDEFNEYFGINLVEELNGESNAIAFIKRVEDRMSAFLNANFYRNIDVEFPKFTEYQKEHYKLALLEQCIYVHRTGDISVDAGYDSEKGVIANDLTSKIIGVNAKNELILCGLWNRHINGHNFWGDIKI